jgi:hypothetical protein
MLTRDGTLKIMDFGLARRGEDSVGMTVTGAVLGTPAYMSPEQAAGRKVDARTDLFSIGVVAYELLSGRRPFPGDSYATVMAALMTAEPEPLNQVDPTLAGDAVQLVHRLLIKDPARRTASATVALGELETMVESRGLLRGKELLRSFAAERMARLPPAAIGVPAEGGAARGAGRSAGATPEGTPTEIVAASTPGSTASGLAGETAVVGAVESREASLREDAAPVRQEDAEPDRTRLETGPGLGAPPAVSASRRAAIQSEYGESRPDAARLVKSGAIQDDRRAVRKIRWPLAAALGGVVIAAAVFAGLALISRGDSGTKVGSAKGSLGDSKKDVHVPATGATGSADKTPGKGDDDHAAQGVQTDSDPDKDGVPAALDRCSDQPEDQDGFEDSDGCPDFDNDKDGILDSKDKCPDRAETLNGFEDQDGCPDRAPTQRESAKEKDTSPGQGTGTAGGQQKPRTHKKYRVSARPFAYIYVDGAGSPVNAGGQLAVDVTLREGHHNFKAVNDQLDPPVSVTFSYTVAAEDPNNALVLDLTAGKIDARQNRDLPF